MSEIKTRSLTQNPFIDAIAGTTIWDTKSLSYAFIDTANADRVFRAIPPDYTGFFQALETDRQSYFKDTILAAFAAYENVIDLRFQPTSDISNATIKLSGIADYITSIGPTAGTADLPGNNPSDDIAGDFESFLLLNTTLATALLPAELGGANSLLSTILHELGHVLGLDHPHESNNGTLAITQPGLADPDDLPTDNRRYTVLSYEDGGLDVLYGREFGHSAGPSALDIAALQAAYGANPTTNNTDTIYRLSDPQTAPLDVDGQDGTVQIGRAFFSIWDTGGIDEITYEGDSNVILNLNDATLSPSDEAATQGWRQAITTSKHYAQLPQELQNDIEDPGYHAGGFFSRIFRNASLSDYDLGGYSIANGVTIENASASNGFDFLIGNEANNILIGGGGEDVLHGVAGDDTLIGGTNNDEILGGAGNDRIRGGAGEDHIKLGSGTDTVQGSLSELAGDRIEGFTAGDQIIVLGTELSEVSSFSQGNQTSLLLKGNDSQIKLSLIGDFTGKSFVKDSRTNLSGHTIIELVDRSHKIADYLSPIVGSYEDDAITGTSEDNFIFGGKGDDTLLGEDGNDHLIGSSGNDILVGGAGHDRLLGSHGADSLIGGEGRDKFVIHNPYQVADQILDFEIGQDMFLLKRLGFSTGLELGTLRHERFTIGSAASSPQHRFIYDDQDGSLFFDPDGSKIRAPRLIAQLNARLDLAHHNFNLIKG